MKIVIAALVRGYQKKSNYDSLIKRNKFIHKSITSKIKLSADLLLFHEGNITEEHQQYINSKSPEDYVFINVLEDFEYDEGILNKIPDLERFNIGYRLMCRFNFYHIWKYVSKYDYLVRIDEDVIVKKFEKSFFEEVEKNFIFGTAKLSNESHKYTNESLPNELMQIFESDNQKFYNHQFPYTNFYITNINFWINNDTQKILKKVANHDLQIIHRWGDLPVIGSLLNYKNVKINLLQNITYSHLSHKNKLNFSKIIKS